MLGVTPPATAAAAVPAAPQIAVQGGLAETLLDLGRQAPPVLSAAAAGSAAVPAEPSTQPSAIPAPALRPTVGRAEGGGAAPSDEPGDDGQTDQPPPGANPAGSPVDPDAAAEAGVQLRRQACDACFADGSWMTAAAKAGLLGPRGAPDPAAAEAALAVVLGGFWGVHRAAAESRTRRRLLV
jgi:hypothetical protein